MKPEELEEIKDMITDCINRDSKLNNWEKHFICTVDEINPEHLTQKQRETLNKIWDRVTS